MVSGWHRRFQGMVGKHTPSFYYLLREVKKEQRDVDMMVMELELNRRVKVPQRHKYAAVTQPWSTRPTVRREGSLIISVAVAITSLCDVFIQTNKFLV